MITIEPILLDVDVSVEEYELELSGDESFDIDLDTAIIINTIAGDHYQGAYIVTPKVGEQTVLATTNKVMDDDVTVLEIPYNSVSNPSGGNTFTIGG